MLNNMNFNITDNLTINEMPSHNSGIVEFMIFVTTIGVSVSIATVFVALITNVNKNNQTLDLDRDSSFSSEPNSDSEYEETNDKYEDKYLEEYNNLEDRSINDEKTFFVEEKTPRGIIKMDYDINNNSFIYFSDTKDIPYKYLETVGRLFVIKNNCKNIYIDYNVEINKEKQQETQINKEMQINKESEAPNNVFAKFKSYNKSTTNIKLGSSEFNKKLSSNKVTNILPDKSNHFTYKGKLIDYDEYINKENNLTDEFEHLDYSSFKKIIQVSEKKTL